MKEDVKIKLLQLLKRHLFYSDGFWLRVEDDGTEYLVSEEEARNLVRTQKNMLERDVTDILSELTFNRAEFDVHEHMTRKIKKQAGTGKSTYFASLDKLYPNNKFRQIMNFYLFSKLDYCFILVGYGSTGKTTFVDVISKIIGESYFGRSDVSLLRNAHGTATLEGKKFYEVAEAQDLDLDTANRLKSIITKNLMYINPKFQMPRTFVPQCQMIMTCNSTPRFRVTDDGIIRRFITIEMNNKITQQNPNFLRDIEEDIPNIIREAIDNPFNIEDFAIEQYSFFRNDYQFGFGYGLREDNRVYEGATEYDKYKQMCKVLGYHSRNFGNFEKFIELAKMYEERVLSNTSLNGSEVAIGLGQLIPLKDEDWPF